MSPSCAVGRVVAEGDQHLRLGLIGDRPGDWVHADVVVPVGDDERRCLTLSGVRTLWSPRCPRACRRTRRSSIGPQGALDDRLPPLVEAPWAISTVSSTASSGSSGNTVPIGTMARSSVRAPRARRTERQSRQRRLHGDRSDRLPAGMANRRTDRAASSCPTPSRPAWRSVPPGGRHRAHGAQHRRHRGRSRLDSAISPWGC